MKVNFELATPNSVRGCTSSFAAPTGQTVRDADAKLAGHMHASPAYMFLWLPFVWGAGCARQDRKSLFERDTPVLGNF